MTDYAAVLLENKRVAEELWRAELELEGEMPEPCAGQFVSLRLCGVEEPLLRRPFSVHSFRRGSRATVGVLYAPVGRWTRALAARAAGAKLRCLGPLGRGFQPEQKRVSILVAGGRGVAPLALAAWQHARLGKRVLALIGAGSAAQLYWEPPEVFDCEVGIATEDGSLGVRGLVTDLLGATLGGERECAVYACGPLAMLRKVDEICEAAGVPCQLSVEAVFACGMGLCRGCAVPSKLKGSPYLMACSDGPVIAGGAIRWESFVE